MVKTMYTKEDFKEGRVKCAYCNKPIYEPKKAMEHFPTQTIYHEKPCFEKAFNEQLKSEGIDEELLSEIRDTIKDLFKIPKN